MNDNHQALIVEFRGPEEKVTQLLEKLESLVEKEEELEITAVTIKRKID